MSRRASLLALSTLVLQVAQVGDLGAAQQGQGELVDRVVAVVGDTAILQSELQEYVFQLQAQGAAVPDDPFGYQQFMQSALEDKIGEMLLVIHARRAGIEVTDREVNQAVEDRLAQIRRQFETEGQFEEALRRAGLSSVEFRIQLAGQTRAELITQRFLQSKTGQFQPTPVSEEEIRQRFQEQKDQLGSKPASVSLQQVVLLPQPSEEVLRVAREKAGRVRALLEEGEDFARLAREYSEDPGTRDEGGLLGWVRRGSLLPEFADALYELEEGETSDVVKTDIGFHIIKAERIRGAERYARHILIRPELAPEDLTTSREMAEEVASALERGADIDSLVALYGDPREAPELSDYPLDQLPTEYQRALRDASPGDVLGPFAIAAPAVPGSTKWAVVRVQELSPAGEWTLADLREPIRTRLEQEKMIRQFTRSLRDSTYVEVRL